MNVYGNGNKEESKLLLFTNEKKTLSTKDFTPIEKYKPTGNFK
jgi:hypothetical protein